MVITNEPGIYLPNSYGVRIEDTVLITKSGCINLTKSNKNYVIVDEKSEKVLIFKQKKVYNRLDFS